MKRAWMVAAGLVMLVASGCDDGTPTGVPTPNQVPNVYTVWADGSKLAERTGPTLHTMHPAWRVR